MDDMKKLVEKYKRELMQYSKAAVTPERLSFPEMLPDEAETSPAPAAEPSRTPRVVGYSDDGKAVESIEKMVSEISAADRERRPAYEALPPQLSGDVPQIDETNSAVFPENNEISGVREPQQPPQFPKIGEHTEAKPAESENLGVIPESGESPDEQLGRRSFESIQSPINSRDDIKPLARQENADYPKNPPEREYSDLDDYLKANARQGSVQFRTYTARNALPVAQAKITVTKLIGGENHTFYKLTTDISGQTEEVTLPAPPASLSQSPDSGVQPYALYNADITADGFRPVSIKNLPVFEGILSVQRAAMVPSAGGGENEAITDTEPNLTEVSDG